MTGSPYDDRRWKRLRAEVRAEEPFCWKCGAPATSVDHIVPVSEAPSLRLVRSNLRSSCSKHNQGRVTPRRQRARRILNAPAEILPW